MKTLQIINDITLVVGVQDAKHSPVAPLVFEEDAERAVIPCLTLPKLVTLPDVQGIVIPQSPRQSFCLHSFPSFSVEETR